MFKKVLAIIMVTIMLLTVVACSREEIGLYTLVRELARIDVQETKGTISFSAEGQILDVLFMSIPEEMEFLKKSVASGLEIKYNVKQKKDPLEFEATVDVRFNNESQYKKLTTIIGNDKAVYIKLNDLLAFLKPYIIAIEPTEEKSLNQLISRVEYIKIDIGVDELDRTIYSPALAKTVDNASTIRIMTEFMDIFQKSFADFSTNTVTKKNNGYEMALTPKGLQQLAISFVEYVYKNIDTIVDTASANIKLIPDQDLEVLDKAIGGRGVDRAEILKGLEEFRQQVKETPKDQLDGLRNDAGLNKTFKEIEGSSLTYYVGKTSSASYELLTDIKVKYLDQLDLNMSESWKINKLPDFAASKPLKYVSQEELIDIVKSLMVVKALNVNLMTRDAVVQYESGRVSDIYMYPVIRDGRTYLPLRQVGETFGETVEWDEDKEVARVIKDGKAVEMTGIIVYGRTYVKIRDFEKVGYEVLWNEETKVATITKK